MILAIVQFKQKYKSKQTKEEVCNGCLKAFDELLGEKPIIPAGCVEALESAVTKLA